jgi:hypothetical protein
MNFLIGEIALWLLGAAALGAVLGAVLSRPRRARLQVATAERDEHQRTAHALQLRAEMSQRRISELEGELAEGKIDRSRLANLEAQLRAAHTMNAQPSAPAGWSSAPASTMPPPPPPPPADLTAMPGAAPPPFVR